MKCAFAPKSGYSAKDDDAVNTMLIMQYVEHFFHQALATAVIRLLQIYPNDCYFAFHANAPSQIPRDIGSAERGCKAEKNG